MKGERLVILGNGGAAIAAARAARTSGHNGEIHIVSDTNTPAFNPMLSPYYLKRIIPWENCFPFGQRFYNDYAVHLHGDSPVESLDTARQQVTLARRGKLSYDKCLIATGASPFIPPIPGLRSSPRSLPLRTASSVRSLEKAIGSAQRMLVLGASLVGLKVAEILRKRGIDVILLDVVDQILPRNAHPSSAALLAAYFEEHGVHVRLGCALEGMEGATDRVTCHFPEGILEEVDFVAVCTGVRPNLDFVRDQVEIKQAVVADEGMRTSIANLYAAGDVSQGINPLSGEYEWLGTWGNACIQGRVAGYNMAGLDIACPGSIQQNISPFFGWTYAQLGNVHPQGEDVRSIIFGDPRREGHFVLVFQRDVLVGANLINCTQLAGKLRWAIVRKTCWKDYLSQGDEGFTTYAIEKILNETAYGVSEIGLIGSSRKPRRIFS